MGNTVTPNAPIALSNVIKALFSVPPFALPRLSKMPLCGAQWNVYPVECLPRAMLLVSHCTGAFPYSTGELEGNIPSGLNFS